METVCLRIRIRRAARLVIEMAAGVKQREMREKERGIGKRSSGT